MSIYPGLTSYVDVHGCENMAIEDCKSCYSIYVKSNLARADCSDTLLDLLNLISPYGFPRYLIGNIVN